MITQSILFIGGGNMTRAIVSGLTNNHHSPQTITVFDRNPEKLDSLSKRYQVKTTKKLSPEFMLADVIILSVKPQSAKEMCFQLQPFFHLQKTLIISVMAGLKIKTLNKWLGEKIPIIRAMPNTPALIGEGATGLFASKAVSNIQKQLAESLLSTIGIIAWLDHEKQIDAITALSGSGPAYFFYMIEAMQIAAKKLGLSEEISNIFSLQTAYGAAKLALNSDISTSALRGQVTSQGGTTEAALSVFQDAHFLSLIEKAMAAASDRSKKLSDFHK